jgi:hypothetical protein
MVHLLFINLASPPPIPPTQHSAMEQQRERPPDVERSQEQESEALPPPPTAFPITEFSRLHSQLLDTPATNHSSISLQTDSDRNPFGDSNAVSRSSFASTTISQYGNPFRSREGDKQSFRDDASSLAPPPEYEDYTNNAGLLDRRISADAPLPSYTAVAGEAANVEEKQGGHDDTSTSMNVEPRMTPNGYPEEKAAHDKEGQIHIQQQQQKLQPTSPETQQRNPAELTAIADAISRAYASSPALDNQRCTRTSSRPNSRSGASANRAEAGTSLAAGVSCTSGIQGVSPPSMDAKGKSKESETGAEKEDIVIIEGRRMSRTMAAELFQMWDNIDRAHGNREFGKVPFLRSFTDSWLSRYE